MGEPASEPGPVDGNLTIPGCRARRSPVRFGSAAATGWLPHAAATAINAPARPFASHTHPIRLPAYPSVHPSARRRRPSHRRSTGDAASLVDMEHYRAAVPGLSGCMIWGKTVVLFKFLKIIVKSQSQTSRFWCYTMLEIIAIAMSMSMSIIVTTLILPEHFRAPDTCWKTTVKALTVEPQFSEQFFTGCSTEQMTPEIWYKFGNFLVSTYGFWEKRVRSLDLPPSLGASALIVEPNACGLHDLECLMTFLQNFSTVAAL